MGHGTEAYPYAYGEVYIPESEAELTKGLEGRAEGR